MKEAARIDPTTTKSATGRLGKKRLPRMSNASAASPIATDGPLVYPMCRMKRSIRSQKFPCAPLKPKNLGTDGSFHPAHRGDQRSDVPDEMIHPFPEVPVRSLEAEKFRQLGADQLQGDTCLE